MLTKREAKSLLRLLDDCSDACMKVGLSMTTRKDYYESLIESADARRKLLEFIDNITQDDEQ